MFEFFKSKKEEPDYSETLKAQQREQEKEEKEVIAKIGKPELEAISHEISERWSFRTHVNLYGKGEGEKDKADLEKLIKENGEKLAAYLVYKRQIIEDKNYFPSHDDQFTSHILWRYGFLEGKEWEKWGREKA